MSETNYFFWCYILSIVFLSGAVFAKTCTECTEYADKEGADYEVTYEHYKGNEKVGESKEIEYRNKYCVCLLIGNIALLGLLLIWPLVIVMSSLAIKELFENETIILTNKGIDIAIFILISIQFGLQALIHNYFHCRLYKNREDK